MCRHLYRQIYAVVQSYLQCDILPKTGEYRHTASNGRYGSQLGKRQIKRRRDSYQGKDGCIVVAALYAPQIAAIHARLQGQRFLRHPLGHPALPDRAAERKQFW
jgi:hypothetical protein